MAFLGTCGMPWSDTKASEEVGGGFRHPLQKSELAQIVPSAAVADNPHDEGGYRYSVAAGGTWVDAFRSFQSGSIIRWYWAMRRAKPADTDEDDFTFFFPHYDAGVRLSQGRIRVCVIDAGVSFQTGYKLRVDQYNGAAWVEVAGAVAVGFACGVGGGTMAEQPVYYITLEIDTSGSPDTVAIFAGDASGMLNSGNAYFTSDLAYNAVVTGTPSIENIYLEGKGGETNEIDNYEVAASDDQDSVDTDRFIYYGASTQAHGFTLVPRGDVPGGGWTAANNAAGCSTDRWRTLDDPWDDEDGVNDYISALADDPDLEQLLTCNDDYHTGSTPTIYGLHVVAGTSLDSSPTHLLTRDLNGAGPTLDVDAGVVEGDANNFRRYGKCQYQTPDGDPWIHGTGSAGSLDDIQVGVRNSSESVKICNILFVHVWGTNLAQPANAGVCPGAVTHIRQGMAIGSANAMGF